MTINNTKLLVPFPDTHVNEGSRNMSQVKNIDKDTHVNFEDQQNINLFARKNAKLQDILEQIAEKEKDMQNLEDASSELMLTDSTDLVPYQIGEVFVHFSSEETQERVEKAKLDVQEDLVRLRASSVEIKAILINLKTKLYSRFGDSINLETEDL